MHQTMRHAQGLPVCVCYNISLTMRLEGSYFAPNGAPLPPGPPPVFQKQIKTIFKTNTNFRTHFSNKMFKNTIFTIGLKRHLENRI